jgi:hypothetical protein
MFNNKADKLAKRCCQIYSKSFIIGYELRVDLKKKFWSIFAKLDRFGAMKNISFQ